MGLLDFLRPQSSSKVAALEAQLATMQQMMGNGLNGFQVWPTYDKTDNAERYCTTDDVYSIIKLIAGTAAAIPIYNYIKGKDGKETEAPENDPLSMILEMPIDGMSEAEALMVIYSTILMQGECILWKEVPEFGPNAGKTVRIHYMEPQSVNIMVSDTWPRRITSYQYAPGGQIVMDRIPVSEIIHLKYFNPKVTYTGNELRGLSPLQVLGKRLTRVDSNMDATTAQLQNGGVPGIVYEKTSTENVSDIVSKRKDNFYKYLVNSSNKGAPYFSAGELGYLQLGLKLADMEVADLAKLDFKKLCNAFGISDRLLNNDATGSEVSDKGARIGLYTNAVMPLVQMVTDGFEKYLAIDFLPVKYCIEADISEVQELQANYSDLVSWLEKAWWLTPNEKREMMKFEASPEPLFNQYLLPSGLQTVEDLQMLNTELPLSGDYGKNNA